MSFYENTLIARQDLSDKDLNNLKEKYAGIINGSSGKVIKTEEWGLLKLTSNINNYNKGIYIHYKFEGNKKTLDEIEKKARIDSSIIRYLTVKYRKLDLENEYFKKN